MEPRFFVLLILLLPLALGGVFTYAAFRAYKRRTSSTTGSRTQGGAQDVELQNLPRKNETNKTQDVSQEDGHKSPYLPPEALSQEGAYMMSGGLSTNGQPNGPQHRVSDSSSINKGLPPAPKEGDGHFVEIDLGQVVRKGP